MADSQQQPWSDNPNAPNISPRVYFDEKANFAGYFIGAILYGMFKTPLHPRLSVLTSFVLF